MVQVDLLSRWGPLAPFTTVTSSIIYTTIGAMSQIFKWFDLLPSSESLVSRKILLLVLLLTRKLKFSYTNKTQHYPIVLQCIFSCGRNTWIYEIIVNYTLYYIEIVIDYFFVLIPDPTLVVKLSHNVCLITGKSSQVIQPSQTPNPTKLSKTFVRERVSKKVYQIWHNTWINYKLIWIDS